MYVYFIRQRGTNFVKIGKSQNPIARLSNLQTSTPTVLEMMGYVPQNKRFNEETLHKRFAAHRVQGEWFSLVPEIEEVIQELQPVFRHATETPRSRILIDQAADDLSSKVASYLEAKDLLAQAIREITRLVERVESVQFPIPERLIGYSDIGRRTNIGLSSINKLIDAGHFPQPIEFGHKKQKLWKESEVDLAIINLPKKAPKAEASNG